jgi:hypothetical protein
MYSCQHCCINSLYYAQLSCTVDDLTPVILFIFLTPVVTLLLFSATFPFFANLATVTPISPSGHYIYCWFVLGANCRHQSDSKTEVKRKKELRNPQSSM